MTKKRIKEPARMPQKGRSARPLTDAQRENLDKGRHRARPLKHSRKSTYARMRQRARRERLREASPKVAQARIEAQEQEQFLRAGPPRSGVAMPSMVEAWHRAAAMTPQQRREAHAARQKRVEAAARASGLVKPWQDVYVSGPDDGSGNLDSPDVWLYVEPKQARKAEPASEPPEPVDDPDRAGLDVE
jgi:hypothetical protein